MDVTDGSTWLHGLRTGDPNTMINRGITAAELLKFLAVPPLPPGVTHTAGLVYGRGGDQDLRLDMWAPLDLRRRHPAVVFIHGGGWSDGDPLFHAIHASELASRGYVAVTIRYRLSWRAPFPAAVEDCKCAVRWLRANARKLGVDPGRIAVSGGSAGGHLALMVALTPGRFEGAGGWSGTSSAVQAAATWYPATDLRRCIGGVEVAVAEFLGYPGADLDSIPGGLLNEASPVHQVQASAPPILTLTGDDDPLCPLPMIQDFHALLEEAGVVNNLLVYPGQDHGWDVSQATWRPSFEAAFSFLAGVLSEHPELREGL